MVSVAKEKKRYDSDNKEFNSLWCHCRSSAGKDPMKFVFSLSDQYLQSNMFFCWAKIIRDKSVRFFGSATPECIYHLLQTYHSGRDGSKTGRPVLQKNLNFYEIIRTDPKPKINKQYRLVFDIDREVPATTAVYDPVRLTDTVTSVQRAVASTLVLFETNNITDELNVIVGCADRIKMKVDGTQYAKHSVHMVFTDIVFDSLKKMKIFGLKVASLMNGAFGIDTCIWSTNRNMRVIGSFKENENSSSELRYCDFSSETGWVVSSSWPSFLTWKKCLVCVDSLPTINVNLEIEPERPVVIPRITTELMEVRPMISTCRTSDIPIGRIQHCRNVFFQFHRLRINKFRNLVFPDANFWLDLRNQPTYRIGNNGDTYFKMNVPSDQICEHEYDLNGRHHSSSNPSQVTYTINYDKQTINQDCFACDPNTRKKKYTFDPSCFVDGLIRLIKPGDKPFSVVNIYMDIDHILLIQLFAAELAHFVKTDPVNGANKKFVHCWGFDETSRLWTPSYAGNIFFLFRNWVKKTQKHILSNMNFADDEMADDFIKNLTKRTTKLYSLPENVIKSVVFQSTCDSTFKATLHSIPHLIPVNDGIILDPTVDDINQMARPRTRDDLFIHAMPFNYIHDHSHPEIKEIEAQMKEYCMVNDDDEGSFSTYEYLQMSIGYKFTGLVHDRRAEWWTGEGSNAKGTIAEAMRLAMGDNFFSTQQTEFISQSKFGKNSEACSPALLSCALARVVNVAETAPDTKYDVPKIKNAAAADPMKARGLYQDPELITPQFKLMIQTNHLPKNLNMGDKAMQDRTVFVKFNRRYVDKKEHEMNANEMARDNDKRKRFLSLRDAFGTWAVIGAHKFLKLGVSQLPMTGEMKIDHDRCMQDLDSLMTYVSNRLVNPGDCNENDTVSFYDFYNDYSQYCGIKKQQLYEEKEVKKKLLNMNNGLRLVNDEMLNCKMKKSIHRQNPMHAYNLSGRV